jgi:hypothetical protein
MVLEPYMKQRIQANRTTSPISFLKLRAIWARDREALFCYGRLRGADAAGATSDLPPPRAGITSSAARMPDLNK